MKRTIALVCSAVLAVTISPFAALAASSGDRGGVSASAPANVERAAATTAPQSAPFADSVDRKKKCTYMCIQSTLPEALRGTLFVNGNTGVLTFSESGITLRDLDTKTIIETQSYPAGIEGSNVAPSISNDQDEVYFFATDQGDGRVYRVDTQTLELTDVSPESPSLPFYAPAVTGVTVAPDNSGYHVLVNLGMVSVCSFDRTGNEIACSDTFDAGDIVSRIFTNSAGSLLFVMGDTDKRFAFDVNDGLALSSETITELSDRQVHFEVGTQGPDGHMYFMDFAKSDLSSPLKARIYKIHMDGFLTDTLDIKGHFSVSSMTVPGGISSPLYVLGTGFNPRGQPNRFRTLYEITTNSGDSHDELKVRKALKIKFDRNALAPADLAADEFGRYILASGEVATRVIPVGLNGSLWSQTFAEYDVCLAGWDVTWDYINLAPGKALREYQIWVKESGVGAWLLEGTVPADGERSFFLGTVPPNTLVKVTPKGVKMNRVDSALLTEVGGAPRPGDPQRGC